MPETKGILQYTTISVSGSNAENLTNILTNLGEKERKVEMIWFAPSAASSPSNDIEFVAKIQQTEILRFTSSHFQDLDSDTNAYLSVDRSIKMDCKLQRGEAFLVGFSKTGATPGGLVTIAYRDLE